MKTPLILQVAATALLLSSAPLAEARVIRLGPVPDFKGIGTVTLETTLPTVFFNPFSFGVWGYDLCSFGIALTDSIPVKINVTAPLFAASYWTVTVPDSWFSFNTPPTEGELQAFFESNEPAMVVDVWAVDLNPTGNEIRLAGFDSVLPEMVPLDGETFFGISGTPYAGSLITSTVGDLPSLLPGFDLSAFSGADPQGLVYVSSASIPVGDSGTVLCVPESSNLPVALGVTFQALLTSAYLRRRSR